MSLELEISEGKEPSKLPAGAGRAAPPCSAVSFTVLKLSEGEWVPKMQVDQQSFVIGGPVETGREAKWFCDQMRFALQKTGCRIQQNDQASRGRN